MLFTQQIILVYFLTYCIWYVITSFYYIIYHTILFYILFYLYFIYLYKCLYLYTFYIYFILYFILICFIYVSLYTSYICFILGNKIQCCIIICNNMLRNYVKKDCSNGNNILLNMPNKNKLVHFISLNKLLCVCVYVSLENEKN